MQIDLEYLCTMMGNLTGIPVRVYKEKQQIFYYSIVGLPKDPAVLDVDEVLKVLAHVGYYINPHTHYYGVLNSPYGTIVIGPAKQTQMTDVELRKIAFDMNIAEDDLQEFCIGMKSIINMPLESTLQSLCTVNYILNEEKLTLEDVLVGQTLPQVDWGADTASEDKPKVQHNSLAIEQAICRIVSKGDIAGLHEFAKNAPAIQSGKVAANQLRQMKNIFIVTATQISRAAIRGGMDVDDALSLSDSYIQRCEMLSDVGDIANLQFTMIKTYTECVAKIRHGGTPTKLMIDVANYVLHHLSEPITTDDIARCLFVSRQNLSMRFHKEAGVTLTEFILRQKIEEAKSLLRYSDKTLLAISSYLGFSSQSHFARTFKKFTSLSPKEYRERHRH